MSLIRFLEPGMPSDVAAIGGKGAGLAFLVANGIRVPAAFVVTADAYRRAVGPNLLAEIARQVARIPAGRDDAELERRSEDIRELIVSGTEDGPIGAEIRGALDELCRRTGDDDLCVAVRSSSIAEDAADKSFAGEHDTFLWVAGPDVDRRVRQCWASLFTARAIAYRAGAPAEATEQPAMAVVVQEMAAARSAGVLMTLNPVNGDRSKVMIESVWGLGEPLVSGVMTPDRFLVDKVTGEIVRREVVAQPVQATRGTGPGGDVVMLDVAADQAAEPSLSAEEIAELVRLAQRLERAAGAPQDAEFAVVAGTPPDNVRLLQCRPETVWSRQPRPAVAGGRTALESVLAALTSRPPDHT